MDTGTVATDGQDPLSAGAHRSPVVPSGPVGRLVSALTPDVWRWLHLSADVPVEQVHLTYGADAAREVTVSWMTPAAVPRPFVRVAGRDVPARTGRYRGYGGWLHHAELRDLEPGTRYRFAIGHAGREVSVPSAVRTAPDGPAAFTFTACGDHGIDRPSPDVPQTLHARRTTELVRELEPAFHLVAGDLSYANGDQQVWDRWFRMIEPSARRTAWMPCIGNHEMELPTADGGVAADDRTWGRYGYDAYRHRFLLPENGTSAYRNCFYAFRYGNVLIVSLDNNDVTHEAQGNRGYTNGLQAAWVERTLDRAVDDPPIGAVVVVMHQTAFSSAALHGSDPGVRGAWHDRFREAGVALVLQGHDHVYERCRPDPDGPVYVTCGNGGHTTAGFAEPAPAWSEVRDDRSPGLVRVSVRPDADDVRLSVSALSCDRTTIDAFQLRSALREPVERS